MQDALETAPCAADLRALGPALDDQAGLAVPAGLPPVLDAHVHLFPAPLFDAIWRWFDRHGWPIRYKLYSEEVIAFLRARGVTRLVALHYAHKPGIARAMNVAMAELARAHPEIVATATVMPGEPEAPAILAEGFALGLTGVKLHCHVQALAADADAMHALYEVAERHGQPVVVHAGREPKSAAYPVDPYAICSADRIEGVLSAHPGLQLCVPHLGADEFDAYEKLLLRYDNLWLDTTMALADYFPARPPERLLRARPERLLYGSDFPNLPYAWDRELKKLEGYGFRDDALAALLAGNAERLFGLTARNK